MTDINIRTEGRAGRITLTRPKALNAVTYDMCLAIEQALDAWRDDDTVALVVIDAEGDKAFSAGGDIADLYATGKAGDFAYGRRFWRDEYRMNAKIHEYDKPIVSFLQGFTMGGGMGVGCHGSHRVDVGGSMILANAPGHLGTYAAVTGARMGPADAILVGFADMFIPQDAWPDLIAQLVTSGDVSCLKPQQAPEGQFAAMQAEIDTLFEADTLPALLATLRASDSDLAAKTLKTVLRNSPLSMAYTIEMMTRLRGNTDIRQGPVAQVETRCGRLATRGNRHHAGAVG